MKTTLFLVMILCLFSSCKNENKSDSNNQQEVIKKEDTLISLSERNLKINLTHSPTYLNPESKPDVATWKEYIDVQTKVYQLKTTTTNKLSKQLIDLDTLLGKLMDSKFPKRLLNQEFQEKIELLSNAVMDATIVLDDKSTNYDELIESLNNILSSYKASKNLIRNIYTTKKE